MLLTLLPFTAWADIVVKPGVATKIYGNPDPSVTTSMFTIEVTGDPAVDKAAVKDQLDFVRIETGENVGTYAFALVAKETAFGALGHDVIVTGNGTLNIAPKDIADVLPAPTIANQEFQVGNWNAPDITWAGMTENDYKITGYTTKEEALITGVGEKNRVHVQGIGNYTGTTFFEFDIAPMTIGDGTNAENGMSAEFNAAVNLTYDGKEKDVPAFTIKYNGVAVADVENNFDITNPNALEMTNAGNKNITIAGKDGSPYQGSFKLPFTIAAKDITDESIEFGNVADVTYTGAAFTPTPAVTDTEILTGGNPTALTDADFDYAYEANTNAGNAAKVKVVGKGNYTGTKEITFSIAKRNLNTIVVSDIADKTYNGLEQEPAIVIEAENNAGITTLPAIFDNTDPEHPTGDYTVTYSNNKNASIGEQKAKATITAVGTSNYEGSQEVEFVINKAVVTVTPKTYSRALNVANPTSDYLVANEYYTFSPFQNGETTITANVTGAPSFTIDFDPEHDNTVGDHANVIKINRAEGIVTGLSAANYKFVPGADATLTITGANNFTIAFKPGIEVTYGDATNLAKIYGVNNANANDYLNVIGLGDDEIKTMTITLVDENGDDVDPATVKNVGTYYLKANPASIKLVEEANEANYAFADVEIANGSFQIVARPIKFKAVDQTLTYGEEPILTTGADRIELVDGSYAEGDGRSDMNLTLTVDNSKYNGSVGEHIGVLVVNADNDNYKFTLNPGNITVEAGAGIKLGEEDSDDLQLISDYAGEKVNVTINFAKTRNGRNLGGERNWVKENWVTLTLPFNITVAELSQKLGYAIVNEIDPSKTKIDGTGSEFYGKLTMKGAYEQEYLPANKPILVKIADDIINRNGGIINFGEQSIVAPATEADLTVNAGKGAKFVGTYSPKTVGKETAFNDGSIWFMIGGGYTKWAFINAGSTKADWTIAPFEAYIDMSEASAAPANMTFHFEELDGTATAIKSINADNLNGKIAEGMYNMNGMKMNSVPTQKGVYIVNGKKVVIK